MRGKYCGKYCKNLAENLAEILQKIFRQMGLCRKRMIVGGEDLCRCGKILWKILRENLAENGLGKGMWVGV